MDKTTFIKEWWESRDKVTLIARPRRFGKTLNMSMLEQFFSVNYEGWGDLFERLAIWEEEEYRSLQETYLVIFLSFVRVKEDNYPSARNKLCEILRNVYIKYSFLTESEVLTDADRRYYERMLSMEIDSETATSDEYATSFGFTEEEVFCGFRRVRSGREERMRKAVV